MNFKSNLLFSLRRLQADKTNSFINLSGLVLGLGIVGIVLVFILNELNYNSSFKHKNQIYRVINYSSLENNHWATTPFVIGETIQEKFAEVEKIAHQYNINNAEVKKNEEYFSESGLLCTESSFFKMFGVSIVQGNITDFDNTDNKILLSEQFAKKYFGKEDVIGELLTIRCKGKEYPMEISGIYKDFPKNSSIKASYIAGINFAFEHLSNNLISNGHVPNKKEMKESWDGIFFTNYLMLAKEVSVPDFEKKLNRLGSEYSSNKVKLSLSIQSLNDIFFNSGKIIDNNSGDLGSLPMLYILGLIGFLILIIACINYFNLTSAQTITQIKSFAVRKVYGASQKSIAKQIIFEYCFLCLLALPFALILAHYSLPYISELLGKSYALSINTQFILSIGILIFITLLTGILTAGFVFLRFASIGVNKMLRGDNAKPGNKFNLRKAMVVFQIIIFIALLSSTILIQKQVRYAFSKDLGFVKEGLISIPLGDHDLQVFKQEIANNPNVVAISGGMWLPPCTNKMYISIPKVDFPDEMINVIGLFVDYHFAETMGLNLVLGNDFDEETNNSGVLINESAVKALGLKEIIGERTAFGPVVGVIGDFNMYSLREAVQPMIIGVNPDMCRQVAVKIRTENTSETIEYFQQCWKNTGGTSPFQFKFTDDVLKNIYETDIRFSKTIGLLAVIAIVIASLGLFGLSLFMSRRRTKEIGIRKTNGAKTYEIINMLNKEFVKWVTIAFVIACPIAWYAMHKWLENFAYKTELSWWVFAVAGLIALGIALLTVSFQSWRAATRNPVESLRYE